MSLNKSKISKNTFCIAPWTEMHFGVSKEVMPCCTYDRYNPFGNLNNTDRQILEKIAIQSLIDEVLKRQEIDENDIKLSDSTFSKEYEQLIASIEKTGVIIDANIKKKIFLKVKLNNEWNQLINQKYRWNVNANINEIEDRLKDTKNIPTDEKELQELKNKLINIEKNKKLEVFSKIHLSKIKKQSLIKFF